jgi:hypothetical protein
MKYYLHRPTGQIHRQAQQPFFNRQTAGSDLPIVQTKLSVSSPTDEHEKEADKTADKVMRMQEGTAYPTPISPVQRKCDHCEEEEKKVPRKETTSAASGSFMAPPSVSKAINRSGQPLESKTRSFMETRFQRPFGHVQVHTDGESAQSARDIQAKAYTSGNHIVFAEGQYQPHTEGGRHLLAHELTHVVQQQRGQSIDRKVEMRNVGRGEQSGFARLPELIEKLNRISTGSTYSMAGNNLSYQLRVGGTLSNFDTQMKNFIDQGAVIPLRLTNRHGLLGSQATGFTDRVDGDAWVSGYVDIDDLLAGSDLGMQMLLVHFIQERTSTNNYAQRMGSPSLENSTGFAKVHAAGIEAEAQILRDYFGDPSIHIVADSISPTIRRVFKNKRGDRIRRRINVNAGVNASYVDVVIPKVGVKTPEEYKQILEAEKAQQTLSQITNTNASEYREGRGSVPPR